MVSILIAGLILLSCILYGRKHRGGPFVGVIANFLFAGYYSNQPDMIGFVWLGIILVFVNLVNFVYWSTNDVVE